LSKTTDGTNATKVLYLAWAGPQLKVGTTTTRTDTNPQVVTGVGFQPSALMLMGANGTATETAMSATANVCLGFGVSSSARFATAFSSEDGLSMGTQNDIQTAIDNTKIFIKRKRTSQDTYTAATAMDLTSLDSDGFTLASSTADSQNTLLLYMAIGAAAVAGGQPTIRRLGTVPYGVQGVRIY
jgi:hypothetical protein